HDALPIFHLLVCDGARPNGLHQRRSLPGRGGTPKDKSKRSTAPKLPTAICCPSAPERPHLTFARRYAVLIRASAPGRIRARRSLLARSSARHRTFGGRPWCRNERIR